MSGELFAFLERVAVPSASRARVLVCRSASVFLDTLHGQAAAVLSVGRLTPTITRQLLHHATVKGLAVIAYCIMPDHLHALVEGLKDDADLRAFVHGFKSASGFAFRCQSMDRLWQQGFHDYVLRDEDEVEPIVAYIIANPVRAGLVARVSEYPWLGSSRHSVQDLEQSVVQWDPPWKHASSRRV